MRFEREGHMQEHEIIVIHDLDPIRVKNHRTGKKTKNATEIEKVEIRELEAETVEATWTLVRHH